MKSTSDQTSEGLPELLECPFCGGVGDQLKVARIGIKGHEDDESLEPEDRWQWYVLCRCCSVEGPWGKSPTSAAGWWNRRAPRTEQRTERYTADEVSHAIFRVTGMGVGKLGVILRVLAAEHAVIEAAAEETQP